MGGRAAGAAAAAREGRRLDESECESERGNMHTQRGRRREGRLERALPPKCFEVCCIMPVDHCGPNFGEPR